MNVNLKIEKGYPAHDPHYYDVPEVDEEWTNNELYRKLHNCEKCKSYDHVNQICLRSRCNG
jgi:hypothetical protein